jgi:hypothetical protein
MPDLCYLCGNPATQPLQLAKSFTAHSACKVPASDKMCDRCNAAINGDEKLLWYWNEGKGKWSRLWGRSLSRLYLGNVLAVPALEGQHTEGKLTAPVVTALATRAQMRDWLISPPDPPFTIAIAESGQKHILPWAQEGHDRNYFPVQFELDSLWIDRAQFTAILAAYESLMGLDFSKTEITSGQYHSDRLMKAWGQYESFDEALASWRGSRLLGLVSHVAQKPAESPQASPKVAPLQPVAQKGQLTLWS